MFEGKKTYIVAILLGLATTGHVLGWYDKDVLVAIYGFLGAGGLATLRKGMKEK